MTTDHYQHLLAKITPWEAIGPLARAWNAQGKQIVFTNGCFDILHRGHVEYLAKAASLGQAMVVGLNTDASVSRLKGPSRPLQDQDARAMLLAALSFVDAVVLFHQDTPYELIRAVQPDFLVKGSDYRPQDIVGYDIVTAKGGQVRTIELVAGYSTSAIVRRMNS